ncbi:MAG: polymer-forming cytoskeletal protein [Anaerolineae bacterium]|nr:polymer-forming cytoskeletal protein [Anaerolineae bacterium]
MFGREKPKTPVSDKIETVIGPNTNLQGDIRSDGGVRIDGIFEGSLQTAGNLIISEGAKVIADISAHNVSVAGAIKGNISANRLEILSTGRVWGDVTVNSFLLDEGGFVRGEIIMQGGEPEPPLIEPPKEPPKPSEEIVDVEAEAE